MAHFDSHSGQIRGLAVPGVGITGDKLRLGILGPSLDKNPGHGLLHRHQGEKFPGRQETPARFGHSQTFWDFVGWLL